MAAIHNDVVHGGSCSSRTTCHHAKLRLRSRLYEDSDVVSSAESNGSGKRKGAISCDGEVIAAVILKFHAAAVAEQADNHATDVERRYRTHNLHVCDVRCGCARGVAHGAVLGRIRRLRLNGDIISCVGHKKSLESEGTSRRYGEIIAAVVLEHETRALEPGHRTTYGNGPGLTRYLDVRHVCADFARAVGYGADLSRVAWLRGNGHEIGVAGGKGRLKRKRAACAYRQVIAAI